MYYIYIYHMYIYLWYSIYIHISMSMSISISIPISISISISIYIYISIYICIYYISCFSKEQQLSPFPFYQSWTAPQEQWTSQFLKERTRRLEMEAYETFQAGWTQHLQISFINIYIYICIYMYIYIYIYIYTSLTCMSKVCRRKCTCNIVNT